MKINANIQSRELFPAFFLPRSLLHRKKTPKTQRTTVNIRFYLAETIVRTFLIVIFFITLLENISLLKKFHEWKLLLFWEIVIKFTISTRCVEARDRSRITGDNHRLCLCSVRHRQKMKKKKRIFRDENALTNEKLELNGVVHRWREKNVERW